MMAFRVEKEIGGRVLSLETGKLAKQAHAAVMVRYADTVVLTAVVSDKPREGIDFFPLTVDYREKTSAAGKFPGGFFKREGRPTLKETLTMRMMDRPVRPLFPADYRDEVQIHSMVLSADQENDPDVLAMIGASAVLALAPIPWNGPIGAVRVAQVEGELVVNPTHAQREYATMELLLSGANGQINMMEVGARQASEESVMAGLALGQKVIDDICGMIKELVEKAGKPATYTPRGPNAELVGTVRGKVASALLAAKQNPDKQARNEAVRKLQDDLLVELCGADEEPKKGGPKAVDVKTAFDMVQEEVVRDMILNHGTRPDGREDGRNPSDLLRGRLPAEDSRLSHLHPRPDPGDGDRHAGHARRTSRSSTG